MYIQWSKIIFNIYVFECRRRQCGPRPLTWVWYFSCLKKIIIHIIFIDRLYQWKPNKHKDVQDVIESQVDNAKLEFEKRYKAVIVAMAEQGLNCALFYDNPDPKTYISMGNVKHSNLKMNR